MLILGIGLALMLLLLILPSLSKPMSKWHEIQKAYPLTAQTGSAIETYPYQSMGSSILFGNQRGITVRIHRTGIALNNSNPSNRPIFIPWESINSVHNHWSGTVHIIDLEKHRFWLSGSSSYAISSGWKARR